MCIMCIRVMVRFICAEICAVMSLKLQVVLRIDKGSPGGALYLGTCIRNYDNCQGILYIVRKIIFFSA